METVDEKLVTNVMERIKAELPSLVKTLDTPFSHQIASSSYDTIYRSQIALAQEFLNENRSADLSRVKCLLPKEYFEYTEQLREHQDPQTIIDIMGGRNIIAPNAKEACLAFNEKDTRKKYLNILCHLSLDMQ